MKNREVSELLQEVLEQGTPAEFQAALLENTLRTARRRKQFRQAGRCGLVLCVVAVAVAIFLQGPVAPLNRVEQESALPIIHSQRLNPGMLVATRQFVPEVKTSPLTFTAIHTKTGGFKILGDDELLACLTKHPAALVRRGNGSADLVFVNPADMEGFEVEKTAN